MLTALHLLPALLQHVLNGPEMIVGRDPFSSFTRNPRGVREGGGKGVWGGRGSGLMFRV